MTGVKKSELLEKINKALGTVRPHLKVDGGDVEVVDVTDELLVKIKWMGNCEMCTMSSMTMRAGIEEAIKGKIPEISGVEAINGVG